MTLDEALLILNDRLGQEVTAWMEIQHDAPLLVASGTLEPWHPPHADELDDTGGGLIEPPPTQHFDLFGNYSVGDARFDLSEAPVESVGTRDNGLTFRLSDGARLIVEW
ncbi:MAG: hypothetical protein QOG15_2294 [Solirubrobacteraceae bacterium]|jgi:hypothetical protein|nr:hypothetical protein [Solirubrobacteraceae bacterium]